MVSSDNGNGHVPSRIVELLISNINALTKEIQQLPSALHTDMSNELSQMTKLLESIERKLNTPPRNEELSDSIDKVYKSLDAHQAITEEQIIRKGIVKLQELMKNLRTVIVTVCTVFSIAVLLTGVFINYSNDNLAEELKKSNPVVEVVPDELGKELEELRGMVEEHLKEVEDEIP